MNYYLQVLKLTSLMSDNVDYFVQALSDFMASQAGIPIKFVNDIAWQERERLLDNGSIQIAWICGLPYVLKADKALPVIELLAAPIMKGERYQGRTIYFSDVIVRKDSPFKTFKDLRGASWAYNEPNSQSGYNIVRYHLATTGETGKYFGRVVASGSHLNSIHMILNSQIDASAIDSTTLELEFLKRPELYSELRIIETLGPSPIPPWVIRKDVAPGVKQTITNFLLNLNKHPNGQEILEKGRIARFVDVRDSDYDTIRHMLEKAKRVII